MVDYTIIPAEAVHMRQIAPLLREASEIEAFGWTTQKALWRQWRASIYSRVAMTNGTPAAAWGLVGMALGTTGTVWMVTTPIVERYPLTFVREIRNEVAVMLRMFPKLQGYVTAGRSQRFLNMLGFTVDDPVVHLGPNKSQFRIFYKERDEIVERRMIEQAVELLGARN